jgi:hypothetical protein
MFGGTAAAKTLIWRAGTFSPQTSRDARLHFQCGDLRRRSAFAKLATSTDWRRQPLFDLPGLL